MKTRIFSTIIFLLILAGCTNLPEKQVPYPISKSKLDCLIVMANHAKLSNELSKAETIMDQIVNCDSNNYMYLIERALMLIPFKNTKASNDINKALIIKDDYAKGYYAKSLLWGCEGNSDSSIYYLNKAIKLEPKNIDYLMARGMMYESLELNHEAIHDFNTILVLDSNNYEAYGYRGKSKIGIDEYQSAIDDLKKAEQWVKNDEALYGNMGIALFKLGKYQECIDIVNKGIAINPNEGRLYTCRGSAKNKLKDRDGACEDFNIAAKLGDVEAVNYCKRCDEYYKSKQIN